MDEQRKLLDSIILSFVQLKTDTRNSILAKNRIGQRLYDIAYDTKAINIHYIMTGSCAEGNPWEVCGDEDFLLTHRDNPVIGVTSDSDFSLIQHKDYPAIVTIRVKQGISSHIPTCHGTFYADSIGFNSLMKEKQDCKVLLGRLSDDTIGPAMTGQHIPGCTVEGKIDITCALKCPLWPKGVAEAFTDRCRSNGWPSPELVDNMIKDGCHVVPSSPWKGSEDGKRYWALGFTVAEKRLSQSYDSTKASCVFILKCLKLKAELGVSKRSYNSYILKTACFWVFARHNSETNALSLAEKVLKCLRDSYSEKKLDSFFIPEHNLLWQMDDDTRNIIRILNHLLDRNMRGLLVQNIEKIPLMEQALEHLNISMSCWALPFWKRSPKDVVNYIYAKVWNRGPLREILDEVNTDSVCFHKMSTYSRCINTVPYYMELYIITKLIPKTTSYRTDLYSFLQLITDNSNFIQFVSQMTRDYNLPLLESASLRGQADAFLYLHRLYTVDAQHRSLDKAELCKAHGIHLMKQAQKKSKLTVNGKLYLDIGDTVHLAFIYYLLGEFDQSKEELLSTAELIDQLIINDQPQPAENRDKIYINWMTPVCIVRKTVDGATHMALATQDSELYACITDSYLNTPDNTVALNPVCLALYISSRIAFSQGERSIGIHQRHKLGKIGKAQSGKKAPAFGHLRIWDNRQKRSCRILEEVLSKFGK